MINIIAQPMGWLLRLIYNGVDAIFDFKYLSAYAISIIIATILFKLVLLPLTLKQTRSMKKMQDLSPQIQELQKKYGKDPQTLQRKQMELYKEANYNPMAGCLPLLLQFPILIAFFYVIRDPSYAFADLGQMSTEAVTNSIMISTGKYWTWTTDINRSFLWIKDLSFAANAVLSTGVINGLSMGGMTLPFIGGAVPILAAFSGYTTYLTSKMTMQSQSAAMNEQQASTQNMMNIMMPIMIFVFSLQFPAGLALYWCLSNVFQLVQQWIILNSSKGSKEELK